MQSLQHDKMATETGCEQYTHLVKEVQVCGSDIAVLGGEGSPCAQEEHLHRLPVCLHRACTILCPSSTCQAEGRGLDGTLFVEFVSAQVLQHTELPVYAQGAGTLE